MHYDPLTYCNFIGHIRVCILSRISRLKSEKCCSVSRENMMRKCCTVKHLDRFNNNPHLPLYLRPIPSDAMVSSTLKLKSLSMHIIIPCDLRVLGHAVIIRNPKSEWFATTKMYFSLTQPVSLGLLCAIMEALPPCKCTHWNMCFGPSLLHYVLEWTHIASDPLSLITTSYVVPLNGRGVGRYWVSNAVSIIFTFSSAFYDYAESAILFIF